MSSIACARSSHSVKDPCSPGSRSSDRRFHWAVLTDYAAGEVTVADSLQGGLFQRSLDELISGPLLSALLVSPGQPMHYAGYGRPHADGLFQMLVTGWLAASIGMKALFLAIASLLSWLIFRFLRMLIRKLFAFFQTARDLELKF